jgi:hypothetical protein
LPILLEKSSEKEIGPVKWGRGPRVLKEYPVDIFGVKKLGVEEWQKAFAWPVNDKEFFFLSERIGEIFHEEVQKSSQTVRDVLLANFGLIQQYSMFLHALMVSERLKKTGRKVLLHDELQYYPDILTGKPRHQVSQAKTGLIDRAKSHIKQLLKFFLNNGFTASSLRKTFINRRFAVSLGSFVRLKREYCLSNHLLVTHTSFLDFLKWADPDRWQGAGEINEAVERMVENMAILAESLKITLNSSQKMVLEEVGRGPLCLSYAMYHGIVRNYPKKIDLLLVAEVAKPMNKVICFALKRKFGTKIIGFEHGNTFGSQLSPYFAPSELEQCDEYVVASSKSIPNFREAQRIARLPYGTETQISSTDSDYYKGLTEKNQASPLSGTIRRVMLIGFPMNQSRYMYFPGHFSLFHLDLELRLIYLLKQRGLKVIYKAHPDRRREVKGVFERSVDEIRVEAFEDVYHTCDAFIFAHTDTSTFGIALCTNKPIVVLDVEGKPWRGNTREMISKRCRMVPAWIDGRCRILFDDHALKTALSEKITNPNREYFEKMMVS